MLFLTLLLLSVATISNSALLQKFDPRIINGEDVAPGEIPYQVSLQLKYSNFHFCGGSIINKHYVVTAAHCVVSKSINSVAVVAGTVNLQRPHKKHEVESIVYHEKYNASNSWINDIALIKVKNPFQPSRNISFVTLPKQNEYVKPGSYAFVSGFGRLSPDGPTSTILQKATIFIASQEYCRTMYKTIRKNIYDSHICANDPSIRRGSCKGDSGGPLTVNGKLVGLVSWAKACSLTDYPTVYTRVPSHINWIKKHTTIDN